MNQARSGLTLIELLVVILILAILISLITPAIFYARSLSMQMSSKNNLRSLHLATDQWAGMHGGSLPSCIQDPNDPRTDVTVHFYITLYLDGGKAYLDNLTGPNAVPGNYSFPFFISPADFTVAMHKESGMMCSYPANAQVFGKRANFSTSFSDGTSNTILFSEHYAGCKNYIFLYDTNQQFFPLGAGRRRSTFADGGIPGYSTYGDVYPVSSASPPGTRASVPGKTFQVRPAAEDCDSTILQTPHSVLLCAFADGSVRTIAKDVSEGVFWSLVTMNGGETVLLD